MPGDEEHSNPFAAPTLAGIANGVVRNHAKLEALAVGVEEIKTEQKDQRGLLSRTATRDDLAEHAQQCPGNPRGARSRPPSKDHRKASWWSMASERLTVVVLVGGIISAIGGAWYWSASHYHEVKQRLEATEKRQRAQNTDTKREIKTEIKKAVRELKEDAY